VSAPDEITPFFILSSGRSGSTLLASMLDMHPHIHMLGELFGLYSDLPRVLAWYGDLQRESNRRLLAHDLARIGQLGEFAVSFDADGFCSRLAASGKDVGAVVRCFYATLLAGSGKKRLGDKTPNHSPYLSFIERLFPDARVIHLVRDGRNCALSSAKSRAGINQRNVQELGTLWPRNNRAIALFGQRHPQRYLRVRYEDLITNPDGVLLEICGFLDEPYDPAMLNFAVGRFARENAARLGHHANLTRGLLHSNRSQWQTGLTPDQVRVYEARAGRALVEFGYELAAPPVTLRSLGLGARYWIETQWRRAARALRSTRVGTTQRAALLAKRALRR
jgi:hypothetical protein